MGFTGGRERIVRTLWLGWGLAVCLPLAIYLRTLCPTIFVGDSGELVAGAHCLGIVHPPGYPLYCLLGRLMVLLPVGSVAIRLNLFSALCASCSAGLIFLLAVSLSRRGEGVRREKVSSVTPLTWAPALLAGYICAFGRTLWSQAVVAEVYGLSLSLLLLCLLLLIRWEEKGEQRHLFAFAFILGLSLAHHPTAILAVPAFLLVLFWGRRRFFENRKNPLISAGFFVLGLSVYLYLPLRASASPPLDWGHPVTLVGTLAHITRASYGSLSKLPLSWGLLGDQIQALLILVVEQFGPALLALSLVGLMALFRGKKIWFASTCCLFLVSGLGIILLLNFAVTPKELYLVQVFFIPSFVMVALWMGIGTGWLVGGFLALLAPVAPSFHRVLRPALGLLLPMLALVPLYRNFPENDRSRDYLAADLGVNILTTLEPGAVVLTSRDTPTFSLAYARIVDGLRPDVSLIHNGPADMFRYLDPPPGPMDPQARPIYGVTAADLPQLPGWKAHQAGIVYQLRHAPLGTDQRMRIWAQYSLRGLDGESWRRDFFLRELVRNYAAARGNLAQDLARQGRFQLALREGESALAMDTTFFGGHLSLGNVYFQMGSYEQAARSYEQALRWSPDNAEILNNMALAWRHIGDVQRAIWLYEQSIALEPRLAKTHNDLGLTYKTVGLYLQAEQAYRRAIRLDPGYADPLRNLGVIYAYHLVDPSRAIVLWERYLSLRPEDEEAEEIAAEMKRMRDQLVDE
jgi:Tfp pilus assembly protein PilF